MDDQVDLVKLNAAGALTLFTNAADEVVEKLQAVETDDKQLQERIAASIETMRNSKPKEAAGKEYDQSLTSIHAMIVQRGDGR